MKVILNKDVKKLGNKGDVVTVSDGYARNFLLPKDLAKEATEGNVRQAETRKQELKEQERARRQEALKKKEALEGGVLEYVTKAGSAGRLFGAITNKDLVASINEKYGLSIDKKKIDMGEHIKVLGEYEIRVKLYPQISANLKVLVKEEE
ncbi:50S ribosomal protein L9 [Clostridia bacterium]|nr:50S ribosomal protein L9 [Clostridia bacterium]